MSDFTLGWFHVSGTDTSGMLTDVDLCPECSKPIQYSLKNLKSDGVKKEKRGGMHVTIEENSSGNLFLSVEESENNLVGF